MEKGDRFDFEGKLFEVCGETVWMLKETVWSVRKSRLSGKPLFYAERRSVWVDFVSRNLIYEETCFCRRHVFGVCGRRMLGSYERKFFWNILDLDLCLFFWVPV